MQTNVIKLITVRSREEGVDETAAKLKQLAAAQGGVAVASDRTTKSTLSVEKAYERLARQYDITHRQMRQFEAAERTLNAAQAQGLITLARKNELLALASAQTDRATAATGRLAAAQRGLSASGGLALGAVGLGGGAAVTGILAAGFAVSAFVKNSIEAQGALAQLNAVIASTGGAAGMSAGELTALASEMQRVTTYGDDAVLAAESLLLTFTKIGRETFPQAVTAILDVSTAMGQDLKSSTVQIGKALNDPIKGITALTRVGVTFTEAQKVMIKSLAEAGDIAGAQAIILRELQTEFAGSAKAARDTLGGARTALGNAFGDLFEVSGEGSVNLTRSINDLNAALSDPATIAAVQDLGAALFDAMSFAVEHVRIFIRDLKNLRSEIEGIINFVTNPAGVKMLSDMDRLVLTLEHRGLENVTRTTDGWTEALVETAPALQRVTKDSEDLATATTKATDAMMNGVKVPLPNLRPEIDNVAKSLDRAQDAARGFAETLVGGLAGGEGVIGSLTKAVGGLTSTLGASLGDKVSGLIGGATSGIFGSILSGLGGGIVSSVVGSIGGIVSNLFGNAELDAWRAMEEQVNGFIGELKNGNVSIEQAKEHYKEMIRTADAAGQSGAKVERLTRAYREFRKEAEKEEERLKRAERDAKRNATQDAMQGYRDRTFVAGLDTGTIEGRLAQFDREARREREAVAEEGGRKLNKRLAALDEALAAERLKIQQDFNDDMIDEARRAQDEINRTAADIVGYINDLLSGPQSTASPQDRLTAAQATFQSQYALAQSGDPGAQASITGYAETFRAAAREMYASSTAYQDIQSDIITKLLALPAVQQTDDPVVLALLDVVTAIHNSRDAMVSAVQANAATLSASFDAIDIDASGGITLAEMQTALGTTNAALTAIFNEIDLNGNGTISRLESLLAADGLTRSAVVAAINAGPGATATALAPHFAAIDLDASGGISLAEMQTALGTTNSALADIFTAIDTNGDGQITQLELIAARTLQTANNMVGLLTKAQLQSLGLSTDTKIGTLLTNAQLVALGLSKDTTVGGLLNSTTGMQGIISKLGNVTVGTLFGKTQATALGLATDTKVASLLTDANGLGKILQGLVNAQTGLPAINTKVTGVASNTGLVNLLTGLSSVKVTQLFGKSAATDLGLAKDATLANVKISEIFKSATVDTLGLAKNTTIGTLLTDPAGIKALNTKLSGDLKIGQIFKQSAIAGLNLDKLTKLADIDTKATGLAKDASLTGANGLKGINDKVAGVAKDDGTLTGKVNDVKGSVTDDGGVAKWAKITALGSAPYLAPMLLRLTEHSKMLAALKDVEKAGIKPASGAGLAQIGSKKYTIELVDKFGTTTIEPVLLKNVSTKKAQGGIIGRYAPGGIVGNGIWNQDSVIARYARGGDIMLAGGEGVINAAATRMIGPSTIDLMNRTGRMPGHDVGPQIAAMSNVIHVDFGNLMRVNMTGFEALVTEVRALRAELRRRPGSSLRQWADDAGEGPRAVRRGGRSG